MCDERFIVRGYKYKYRLKKGYKKNLQIFSSGNAKSSVGAVTLKNWIDQVNMILDAYKKVEQMYE